MQAHELKSIPSQASNLKLKKALTKSGKEKGAKAKEAAVPLPQDDTRPSLLHEAKQAEIAHCGATNAYCGAPSAHCGAPLEAPLAGAEAEPSSKADEPLHSMELGLGGTHPKHLLRLLSTIHSHLLA